MQLVQGCWEVMQFVGKMPDQRALRISGGEVMWKGKSHSCKQVDVSWWLVVMALAPGGQADGVSWGYSCCCSITWQLSCALMQATSEAAPVSALLSATSAGDHLWPKHIDCK